MDDRAAIAHIRAEGNAGKRLVLIGAFVTEKEALVRVLAEKYARIEKTQAHLDDIHQAGRAGLVKALETWDPEQGALSTWAGWRIRRCVQDLAHTEQPIKLPQIRGTTAERERVMRAVRANPDVTAAELGIKDGMLDRVKKTMGLRYVSVDMFGDGDDAPARARRIERRLTETGDVCDPEQETDERRAVCSVLDAIRHCASVAKIDIEDVIAGAARALGCETVKASADKTRTKKAPPACPTPSATPPPTLPRLRPRPLPPPLLRACVASRPRLVALPLRRSSAPLRPLPKSTLRPLPIPQRRLCRPPSPCSKPPALFLPRFGISCETSSLASKAA